MILANKAALAARDLLLAGSVLAAGAFSSDAWAQESADAAATRFGARGDVLDISLSPSGNKIVFVAAGPGHTEVVNVIDFTADAAVKPVLTNTEKVVDIDSCQWASEERLLCQFSGMGGGNGSILIPFDRLIALNADGTNIRMLSQRDSPRALGINQFGGDVIALDVAGEEGMVMMTRNFIPETTTGSRLGNEKRGLGVDLVDTANGRGRVREQPDDATLRYIADEQGQVRIKVQALSDINGNLTGAYRYFFRKPDSSSWVPLEALTIDGMPVERMIPLAVDSARNVAFGFVTKSGYDAIAEVALDGTGSGKLLMARGDVDVDGLIRIGRKNRVVGASYATEKREIAYFDPALAKLAADLGKALPDQPLVNIVGASADEQKLLLIASSDTQPGMVYLFDRKARALEPLLPLRPRLEGQAMGQMKPVSYPARDGTMIPAYLTLPPGSNGKGLPAIVLPHGGPAARDEWGFDWLVQYFTAKGYAVLQPNYRGSSGYGEAWYGRNGFKAWEVAIGDVNDAGRWLVSEGIVVPDKLAVAGWSYGGYAALQSQVLDPALFKAVVAIAPVTDLGFLIADARDYTNSRLVRDYVGEGPHVASGSPRRHAEKFAAPVALFHGTRDLNVDVRHAQAMERALKEAGKSVTYREYADLQHGLDDSAARAEMLADIGRFLDEALAGG
ncbi:acetyl esterase/lipase [Erythromicrobium ramosum]|uniref:Acetyl esterase/lipase n=1 Tax=Erythrobacter ramosus TaxID=35811 RepID=A0A6I4ULU7_9SPHN|nr:S9 family peptidase [Erythrobacter ramosus]MBB3776132.1 acetyl esterase/lipase [Erythrobacter ramosus]MXP38784.1 alpha/beta fold hydrolase [Erythrobacter ramosus]